MLGSRRVELRIIDDADADLVARSYDNAAAERLLPYLFSDTRVPCGCTRYHSPPKTVHVLTGRLMLALVLDEVV